MVSEAVVAIAENVVELLNLMVAYNKISKAKLHLVGFDLGAHVVGNIGRAFQIVARITGEYEVLLKLKKLLCSLLYYLYQRFVTTRDSSDYRVGTRTNCFFYIFNPFPIASVYAHRYAFYVIVIENVLLLKLSIHLVLMSGC